jgi:hypothetical protein
MGQSLNDLQDARRKPVDSRLQMLTPEQVRQIDRALADLGPSAEVRLIKTRGRLRFIQKIDSESITEPQPRLD